MHTKTLIITCMMAWASSGSSGKLDNKVESKDHKSGPSPCTCGVFLSGQFVKGSKQPPKGNPALLQEMDSPFMNNAVGNRQCMNKCLELIGPHAYIYRLATHQQFRNSPSDKGCIRNTIPGEINAIGGPFHVIVKHLAKSADIVCATIDRDCHKERAYLFIKNYNSTWVNTNLSAGREFCCKDNEPYKCPL